MRSPLLSPRIRALVSLTVQKSFTPSICVLLAIGSVILGLVWVFLDFFGGMAGIDVYSWLPLIVLLAGMALLMTEKWLTTALAIPLVIVALTGLYYLLLLIGALALLPTPIIGASGLILLILLNGSVCWMTRRVRIIWRQEAAKRASAQAVFHHAPKSHSCIGNGRTVHQSLFLG